MLGGGGGGGVGLVGVGGVGLVGVGGVGGDGGVGSASPTSVPDTDPSVVLGAVFAIEVQESPALTGNFDMPAGQYFSANVVPLAWDNLPLLRASTTKTLPLS